MYQECRNLLHKKMRKWLRVCNSIKLKFATVNGRSHDEATARVRDRGRLNRNTWKICIVRVSISNIAKYGKEFYLLMGFNSPLDKRIYPKVVMDGGILLPSRPVILLLVHFRKKNFTKSTKVQRNKTSNMYSSTLYTIK